jgi:hypothetical protein
MKIWKVQKKDRIEENFGRVIELDEWAVFFSHDLTLKNERAGRGGGCHIAYFS